jgi:hypothetical protein
MSCRRSIAALETLVFCSAVLTVSCASGEDLGRPPLDDGQAPLNGSGGGLGAGGSGGVGGVGVSGGTVGAGGSTGGRTGGAAGAGGVGVGSGGTGGAGASGGSGGAVSSGGAVGSGGSAASGGAVGSGGASGSGGVIGAGGSCGSSGSPGTGGSGASGDAGAIASFCSLSQYAFCDDFEDGNACGWTPSGGSWSVSSDMGFVYSGASGSYNSTVGTASWTDQTVEGRVKILQFGGSGSSYRAGIIARYGQSTNYYTLAIDAAGDVRLLRGTSSPSGASGTCDAVPSGLSSLTNTWIDLKIQVSGSAGNVHILTWVNGKPVHDCTTTSSTLAMGAAGVMTYGSNTQAEFDDFRVSTP